jgi:hypothetical protein
LLISQSERFYEANSGKGGKSSTKEKRDKSTFFPSQDDVLLSGFDCIMHPRSRQRTETSM